VTSADRSASLRAELTAREKDAVAFQAVVVLGGVPTSWWRWSGPRAGTGGSSSVRRRPPSRWPARPGLVTAVLVLPAGASGLRSTVVGTRNPLWQLGLSAAVRVVSGCLTVLPAALAAAKRRRAAQLTGE
jgi:hypothetical protein